MRVVIWRHLGREVVLDYTPAPKNSSQTMTLSESESRVDR